MIDKEQLHILLNVLIATLLCGIVGFERESMHKPAGLRTNMIIGGASCLMVSITIPLIQFIESQGLAENLRTDPIRIMQALVIGVSFVGAGTILKQKDDRITGLTSAATLLYCLGIGVGVAIKLYTLAIGITILILLINFVIRLVEAKYSKKKKPQ